MGGEDSFEFRGRFADDPGVAGRGFGATPDATAAMPGGAGGEGRPANEALAESVLRDSSPGGAPIFEGMLIPAGEVVVGFLGPVASWHGSRKG